MFMVIYHKLHQLPFMWSCPWNKLIYAPGVARGQVMQNFICLLPEFPVRCSALKPCWFRWQSLRKTTWSHSNQPICTFALSHSRAGTKWATVCFLFNSVLSAECEVSLSLHPELHQIALMPQKTQTCVNFIESYIGSYLFLDSWVFSFFMLELNERKR